MKQVYLLWHDDNPKKAAETKIAEASQRFIERIGSRPNVVLCNQADICEVEGMVVRVESYIRRGHFWIGWEDSARPS